MTQQEGSVAPKKYVEPTLHFARKRVQADEGAAPVEISELVRPGQLLADFPDFEKLAARGFHKQPLKAGHNTLFSQDGQSLVAEILGYPKIEQLTGEDGADVMVISLVPLVRFSFDKLRAFLIIYPTLPGRLGLEQADLYELIEQAGVRHGLHEPSLDMVRRTIASGELEITEIAIAEGQAPGPGVDASLKLLIEIGPIAGLFREDGSIDFRERRIMVGVEKDQLVAEKIPPVPGEPGVNVLGEPIEPKSGREITIHVQGDAVFDRETREIRATKNGVLSVVNRNALRVSAHQVINGNIDFETGNIDANGCLTIKGSVTNGFSVTSVGDLKIGGSVMSAKVSCESNVVIQGGITGKTTTVCCGGDLDLKFVEQGAIDAGGLVVIRSQSYFSRVHAGSDIRCHPESKIMGGALVAAGHLSVGTVGGESSDPALLGAGIDPERLVLYESIRAELSSLQNELIQWLQLHGRARSRKVRKMEEVIDETKLKLLKLNLIPGTELYSRGTNGTNRDEVDEISPLYHQGLDVDNIRIDIHGAAFAGTRLLLGNRSLLLPQSVSKRQFKLSADMKRIISFPLRG